MDRILFVCTGNIFRSLTAERGLRRALGDGSRIQVSSAGTEDFPHIVMDVVREYLLTKGLDVTSHQRRTLTAAICDESTLIVAMSDDHQRYIQQEFGRTVPLFTEVCGLAAQPLLDVDDVVPDFATNHVAAQKFIHSTIDRILDLTPKFAERLVLPDPQLGRWRSAR